MNKKLLICFLFFHVCASIFSSEIDLNIQHIMGKINDLKLCFSIMNTTNDYEFEISEHINDNFAIINEYIENIIDRLCKNQSIHISLPLAIRIKTFTNVINNRRDTVYNIGMKNIFGVFQYFEDLNFLFDLANDLRWVLTNFPLVDTNAWITKPILFITYNRIKESINILEEIQDDYFRTYVSNPHPNLVLISEKIQLLRDIANDNLDSFFFEIITYELIVFENIINRNDSDVVSNQLMRIDGLYRYVNFITSAVDLE